MTSFDDASLFSVLHDGCPECRGLRLRRVASITVPTVVDGRIVSPIEVPVIVACGRCGGEGTASAANLRDARR